MKNKFVKCTPLLKKGVLSGLLLVYAATGYGNNSISNEGIEQASNRSPVQAASRKLINGIVTDDQNQPLPGVMVSVKGTQIGAVTDARGEFQINVPGDNPNAVLVIKYIGYNTQEIKISGQSSISVKLTPAVNDLDEVVVVGYGAMKKSSLTGSVSKLNNEILDEVPSSRPETALAGRMAGVNVTQSRNSPGSPPVIVIRGIGSIDAGNEPLVVIDGFPGGSFSQVNMNDIESIEVLKDASSAAIYGSRASGGVVIISTKKGKAGKPKLNFNSYYGVAKPILHDDWLTGEEYYNYLVKYQNRELRWDGGDPSTPVWDDPSRLPKYRVNPIVKDLPQTIWQNEVIQDAPTQSINLAVNGGTDNVKYYVSGVYNNEKGVIKTQDYKFYGLRANVDVKVNDIINMGVMLNPSYVSRRLTTTMVNLAKYPPFVAPINPDGTYPRARDYWGENVTGQANPNGILNGTHNTPTSTSTTGETFISLDVAKGLKLRSSLGVNIISSTSDVFAATYTGNTSSGSASDSRSVNLLNENTLNYNAVFNEKHDFTGLLGASFQKSNSRRSALVAQNGSFNNDILYTLDNAIINPVGSLTSKSQWGLVSYFARVNYAYDGKYLLAASIRTDGSSRFGQENKWGYFPSASVAWRVSEENFMKAIPTLSNLKLRASYGVTGNFNIGDFDYLGRITSVNYSPNDLLTKGQAQTSFQNDMLSWEKTRGYDVGVELGLFRNRLNVVFDYYDKKTTDMLYNIEMPAITGFTSTLYNVGSVSNKGIELELRTVNLNGDFNWQTSFNFSRNKNKVLDLGGARDNISTDTFGMSWILRQGEQMFSYYGYKAIGVLQNAQDVANSPVYPGSKPGNPKYADINGDNKIDAQDRVILGSYLPKYTLGLANDFSWKNFTLSIAMQASLGAKMYTFENQYYQGNVLGALRRSLVENQWWSEEEPGDGRMPGAALSQLNFQGQSDIYLEDASFLAVRNINLGYNFPSSVANKMRMSSLRVYTSINNLFVLTNKDFHGYNPEGYTQGDITGANSRPGYNASGSEPINRVYTLGLNVGF